MKIQHLMALVVLSLLTVPGVRAAVLAGPITNAANGHVYYLLSANTWTASEAEAQALGGHLVTISEADENEWVVNTFFPLTGVPYALLWIGFNDETEFTYRWPSGEFVVFSYWGPGEPNQGVDLGVTEDYAAIRHPSDGPPTGSWKSLTNTAGQSPNAPIFGVVELTTPPLPPPTPVTQPADQFMPGSAQLNALVNPNGSLTLVWFEWGPFGDGNGAGGQYIGSGTNAVGISNVIDGLVSGTTYRFRVWAMNAFGLLRGAELAFTLSTQLPVVTTLAADQLTTNSARLRGQVNPRGWPTTAWFEWGTDTNYGNLIGMQDAGQGSSVSNLNVALGGLTIGQNYYYRLVASNGFGLVQGQNQTFNLNSQRPGVTSLAADSLTTNSARLRGQVNPNGWPTTAWFGWGTDTNYGNLIGMQEVGQGSSVSNLNVVLNGLTIGQNYHYRLVASNALGLATGVDQTLNLNPQLPAVTTLAADQLTTSSARLKGQVNPRGWPTTAWFEWGTDINYGNLIGMQEDAQGSSVANLNVVLDGLMGGPTYHYRLGASNAFGAVYGGDQMFGLGFVPIPIPGLPQVFIGSVACGDYDNDGRLDVLLTGYPGISQLWRNTGSGFSNVTASVAPGLPGVYQGSVAWGDYDNDGRLDFLLTGSGISQLWRNTGNGFSNVTASVAPGLPGVSGSSVAWGDYDNDGRPDFLLTGGGGANVSQLWRNTGSGFSNVTASVAPGLPGVSYGAVAWGDYDNDGRLDFLLTGSGISQVWRNTGSGFSNVTASVAPGLAGVYIGSVAWGDYDNDGRLDFLLASTWYGGSQLWRNTGNGFSNVTASVAPGLPARSSVAWADYDNDGRLDFLIAGTSNAVPPQLWRNTGSGFSNVTASVATGLPGSSSGSVAWGDFDNDGRLDFLHAAVGQLWRNNMPVSNAPPAAPTGLSSTLSGATVSLSWSPSDDDRTPSTGLNYNLRIGTTPGASDVLVPMALTDGLRLLPALGNAQTGTNALMNLPLGRYYWSVQAVDTSFAGSPFAVEQQFTLAPRIFESLLLGNDHFQFSFTNQSSAVYEVLGTTNVSLSVAQWNVLGLPTHLGGGLYRFTDTGASNNVQRFYLLRQQ